MQALDLCHPYILSDEINARTRNETSIVIYNTVAYFGYETTVNEHIYIYIMIYERGIIAPAPPHLIMIQYNHASLAKHVTNEFKVV